MNKLLSKFDLLYAYLQHQLFAGNEHTIHPPFVFELYCDLIKETKYYIDFQTLNQTRGDILKDRTIIQINDFGAGSIIDSAKKRKVKDIASSVCKPIFVSQFLYKLVNKYQPKVVIELGTSLGITTSYLAMPYQKNTVYTLEGCEETLHYAKNNNTIFSSLPNIKPILGNFDLTLPDLMNEISQVDLVYVDGNHRLEPTVRYFELLLKKSSANTILIFDDIHWSKEMIQAWQYITQHTAISTHIDLFYFGIAFLNPTRPKQGFKLRF